MIKEFMIYDNREYWTQLHANLKGQPKAVEYPLFSESLDQLKYNSEASTIERALQDVMIAFRQNRRRGIGSIRFISDNLAGMDAFFLLLIQLLMTKVQSISLLKTEIECKRIKEN